MNKMIAKFRHGFRKCAFHVVKIGYAPCYPIVEGFTESYEGRALGGTLE